MIRITSFALIACEPSFGQLNGTFARMYLKSLRQPRDYADAFGHTKPSGIRLVRTLGQSQTPRMLVVPKTAQTKM